MSIVQNSAVQNIISLVCYLGVLNLATLSFSVANLTQSMVTLALHLIVLLEKEHLMTFLNTYEN